MEDSEEWFLHLDCADLRVYDKPLYERLVRYPAEVCRRRARGRRAQGRGPTVPRSR